MLSYLAQNAYMHITKTFIWVCGAHTHWYCSACGTQTLIEYLCKCVCILCVVLYNFIFRSSSPFEAITIQQIDKLNKKESKTPLGLALRFWYVFIFFNNPWAYIWILNIIFNYKVSIKNKKTNSILKIYFHSDWMRHENDHLLKSKLFFRVFLSSNWFILFIKKIPQSIICQEKN